MPSIALLLGSLALLSTGCSHQNDDEVNPGIVIPIGGNDSTDPGGVDTNGDGIVDSIAKPGEGNGGEVTISRDIYSRVVQRSCNLEVTEPETLPSKLELVIDVSSSMTEIAAGSTRNKWLETRDAIVDAFLGSNGSTSGLPDVVATGLLFYPNIDTNPRTTPADVSTCVKIDAMIPMEVLGGTAVGTQRARLRDALMQIQLGPRGTPTYDALRYGIERGLLEGGKDFVGEPYVVLITDGMPTLSPQCSNPNASISDVDPQPIVDLIDQQYRQNGVKTYLIGSPGSEKGRAWMSHAAVLGHTAPVGCIEAGPNYCHMDLTSSTNFGAALRESLGVIAGEVVSCSYDVYAKSIDESKSVDPLLTTVMVKYASGSVALINRDDTPNDCSVGWTLDATKKRVVLCTATCNKVQSDPLTSVTVSYGCPDPIANGGIL